MTTPRTIDIDWILKYQKELEEQCPPNMDEHTRTIMLMSAPAIAIRNELQPIIEDKEQEIARLRAKVAKLEKEKSLLQLYNIADFMEWVSADDRREYDLFRDERVKERNIEILKQVIS